MYLVPVTGSSVGPSDLSWSETGIGPVGKGGIKDLESAAPVEAAELNAVWTHPVLEVFGERGWN